MKKNYSGFTLTEFMVGLFIFTIISGALMMSLHYTRSSIETAQIEASLQEELQNALEDINLELRQTSQYKITAGPALADDIWYNNITFAVPFDIDSDGDILNSSGLLEWSNQNPANWTVNYSLNQGQLIRTAGDLRPPILANNIAAVSFRRLSTAPEQVEISITASKTTFLNRQVTMTMASKVEMRN